MYIVKNYSISAATLAALAPGVYYWVTNVPSGQVLPLQSGKPADYFDLSGYDFAKIYVSNSGLTTSTGGNLFLSDLWPDPNQAIGGPNQAGSFAIFPTLTTTAQTSVVGISTYSTPATLSGGSAGVNWKFTLCAVGIEFTTVPTAGALQIIVGGERYGHEG